MYSITEGWAVDSKDFVRIEMSSDEALILFDLLAKYEEVEFDNADRKVLSNLEALLEKQLAQPFAPNYKELVAEAKARLN
jgi:hypothetical protein